MKAKYFKTLKPLAAVTVMESGESLLIYNQLEESFHALNKTAKVIWLNANATVELKEFAQALEKKIVPSKQKNNILKDLGEFISELHKSGLLTDEVKLGKKEDIKKSKLFHGISIDQYDTPKMQTYTKEWMKDNHPGIYYKLYMYADTWTAIDKPN